TNFSLMTRCSFYRFRAARGVRLLPVLAVRARDRRVLDGSFVEAARVDAVAVRMRARHVERLDAADRAERVLRGLGVELVSGECVRARKELEARLRHDQMKVAGSAADRAITIGNFDPRRRHD